MVTSLLHRSLQSLRKLGYSLMPGSCILCQLPSQQHLDLCEACAETLPYLTTSCQSCALPLPADAEHCGQCLKQHPSFERTYAAFHYAEPISKLVNQFKFQEKLSAGKVLTHLLANKLEQAYRDQAWPELIMPVPLHRKRLRQRGFNQANEMAKQLSQALTIPLQRFSAKRQRNTLPQSQLPAKKRLSNLRQAFTCKPLHAKHIAVVDDVMTTTTTVNEFCRTLKAAGAEKIDVWCLARTSHSHRG